MYCVRVCVYIYTQVYVCVCTHTHTHTHSNSSTYVSWTLRKFLLVGGNFKNCGNVFCFLQEINRKSFLIIYVLYYIILLYYILFFTRTCLNLFIVYFEARFCNFFCE
jgi:hypothetical protein